MTRWGQGEADVERLLQDRRLQSVRGAQADGQPMLDRAAVSLRSARLVLESDPSGAYVLAYDAARQACTALLVQQGLRPTSEGGHYVVEEVLRAQFGAGFRVFGTLRRRRNELEYPRLPDETAHAHEAEAAIGSAEELLGAAQRLLPNLGLF